MIYILAFIAFLLIVFGKEAGQMAGLKFLGAICTLIGCAFVGGGMIFLAIAGRFL